MSRLVRHARSAGKVSTRTIALAGAAFLTVGLLPATSQATELSTQPSFLAKVGPAAPDTGFPTYYQDSTGLRLAHCFDGSALCGGVESPLPDPTQPASFPNNFPFESFYFLAQSVINLPSGGRAKFVATVEASFNSAEPQAGAQMTFSRIRFVIDTPAAGTYTITHPYGKDSFTVTAGGPHSIFETADIGIASGVFTGALQGRIDPFLISATGLITDPATGAQFIGDPNTTTAVIGSPFGTNFFQVDGPDIGGVGVNTISTDQFTLVGKIQTNSGVDPGHPTYSRTDTTGGMVDVLASTDPGKNVRAQLPGDTSTTSLRGGADGSYVARMPFTGATPPTKATVRNDSDTPPAVFTVPITDMVTITNAAYDSDAKTLTVSAASSDQATPPTLTATGFGNLAAGTQVVLPATRPRQAGSVSVGSAAAARTPRAVLTPALSGNQTVGTQTFANIEAPPEFVTVTSSLGGSDTENVTVTGSAFASDPVLADAGADQTVQQGQLVTLDGTRSTNFTSLAWTQVSGPAVTLTGANTTTPTFTAPSVQTTMAFQLTAQGPGGPATDAVTITVAPISHPVANAGPDQTGVLVGDTVVLDASASTGAATFAWTQVSGPAATLSGTNTARPTFTMPSGGAVTFQVTVTGPGGSASDTVTVTAQTDSLTITRSEYRPDSQEWRVEGTSSILNNNTISVFLGTGTTGPLIGSALVDPVAGTWSVRVRPSPVQPTGSTVTVQSSRGALLLGVPFALH